MFVNTLFTGILAHIISDCKRKIDYQIKTLFMFFVVVIIIIGKEK